MFFLKRCIPILLIFFLSACTGKVRHEPIADLERMPQDLTVYAQKQTPNHPLMPQLEQQKQTARLKRLYYQAWAPQKTKTATNHLYWAYHAMKIQNAYDEQEHAWTDHDWENIKDISDISHYPSRSDHGITINNTSLRAMPTTKAWYKSPHLPGEGYPFDYFQNSALLIGTPVFISHVSTDGNWLLVQTSMASGWVLKDHIALVDQLFKEQWIQLPLAAIVKDNTLLAQGVTAHIGTLLPKESSNALLYPVSKNGYAKSLVSKAPSSSWATVPMIATPKNIADIGNQMIGQLYGWGGIDEKRDCSAMLRDLFIPFGILLPRNSSAQANVGKAISLQGFSASMKEQRIQEKAIPFFSIIWLPGHSALYLGKYNNDLVLFHNVWGVRTTDLKGDGRALIAKAVVTSLRPGAELPNIGSPASILDRINKVAVLP